MILSVPQINLKLGLMKEGRQEKEHTEQFRLHKTLET